MSTNNMPHYYPPHVLMLQALHHRLPRSHSRFPYVEKKIRNELSGFYGESRLFYPLSKLPIYHQTLPNIRLFLHSNHFQIDLLVITSKFLLILESKYYSDDLIFDDTVHQVIQQKDDGFNVFGDPVLQTEEQSYQLSGWLDKFGYSNLPIEYFVVMTNPNSRLRIDPSNSHHAEKVVSLQRLPSLFRELSTKYEETILTPKEIKNLTLTLSQNHQTYDPDILKLNKVNKEDLLKGVFCMQCGKLGMKMTKRRWQCSSCGHRDANAHENALKDYYLLVNKDITNQDFRKFVMLEARTTARDMLLRTAKNTSGNTKSFQYHLKYSFKSTTFDYLSILNTLNN